MSASLSATAEHIPVAVLGGTGYVAGELLRWLLVHPRFAPAALVSTSSAGEGVTTAFPHLAGTDAERLHFESPESLGDRLGPGATWGLLAATPHGATAALLDGLLGRAEAQGARVHAVDLSADFRFASAGRYEAIYGHAHPAPHRLPEFTCAPPDLLAGAPTPHATQPGCYTTAVTLGAYPFFALGLVEPSLFASAITGSSGSGRTPGAGTHHPERRSALYAYSPLAHRHEPEMRMLLGRAAGGEEPEVEFVPHSGPFVRGIHATLRMSLHAPASAPDLVERVRAFYGASPFVRVGLALPRLTSVVGTNRCAVGIATRGRTLVVTTVIDNLVKGAAGGGLQWLNRLFGLPDDTGLGAPGWGWF